MINRPATPDSPAIVEGIMVGDIAKVWPEYHFDHDRNRVADRASSWYLVRFYRQSRTESNPLVWSLSVTFLNGHHKRVADKHLPCTPPTVGAFSIRSAMVPSGLVTFFQLQSKEVEPGSPAAPGSFGYVAIIVNGVPRKVPLQGSVAKNAAFCKATISCGPVGPHALTEMEATTEAHAFMESALPEILRLLPIADTLE
jgi:hypothetical protein